jgi:hypothetical protein
MKSIKAFVARWWVGVILLAALPIFYIVALGIPFSLDSSFFTFWLAGHMNWTGEHPYDSAAWVGAHPINGVTWIPNQIFPYPLPLALLMAPLGLFPMAQSFVIWTVVSQVLIAASILVCASLWEGRNQQFFALLIVVAFLLNSNMRILWQTGSISALFLLFLLIALYLQQKGHDFPAGIALALLALKPSFLIIAALIGFWLLLRRNWKMIGGGVVGGLLLFIIGLMQDVAWVSKFRGASENLFSLRVGSQPTIVSYTRLACGGEMNCAIACYAVIALLLVALYAWLIWKNRAALNPLSVFSAAITLGVLLPPYIWSYDYVLLVIPVCYICFEGIRRTRKFIWPTLFLLLLDGLSFVMIILFTFNPESSALTIQRDMWSIWVGVLVLVTVWWMVFGERKIQTGEKVEGMVNG